MKKIFQTALLSAALLFTFIHCASAQLSRHTDAPADSNVILPPSWAFGMLWGGYTNQQQSMERVEQIVKHDYPIDAYWIDSWFWDHAGKGRGPRKYIDFVADTIGYPNRRQMWDMFQQHGVKGGFWTWDCIMKTGNEEAFEDFLSKGFFRDTYIETNSWHNDSESMAMFQTGGNTKGTLNGNIDFNNPRAVAYFKQRMKHFFDEGADFIKLDRTSEVEVCRAMFEMSQEFGLESKGRGFVMSHSFGTENEEYKRYPCKWTDDTRSDWDIENPSHAFPAWIPRVGLKENIAMYTNPEKKTSQIPFLCNDTGGFDKGEVSKPEDELFIRWFQFSTFTQIMQLFSQPENPTANVPFLYSEEVDKLFKEYSHLRMQLFPYIYSYAQKVRLKGEQMMKASNYSIYDYHFGNEFFVAPVFVRGMKQREVQLPQGTWTNYWTNETLSAGVHQVNTPIEQIPLFVRQGSIIPMRAYAQNIEKGTNDELTLHLYLGADGQFTLIEDDGQSNGYLEGEYGVTEMRLSRKGTSYTLTIDPIRGIYKGMPSQRKWNIVLHRGDGSAPVAYKTLTASVVKPVVLKIN